MSLATEFFVPSEPVPGEAVPSKARAARPGTVSVLLPPTGAACAPPVRLTRRGIAVIAVMVLAGCAALWCLAARSAPEPAAPAPSPRSVTVAPGDTLWSIATRVAPQRDPRAEVGLLARRNHLVDAVIVPGQVLWIR